MEKPSSTKPVPGAKKVGDRCPKGNNCAITNQHFLTNKTSLFPLPSVYKTFSFCTASQFLSTYLTGYCLIQSIFAQTLKVLQCPKQTPFPWQLPGSQSNQGGYLLFSFCPWKCWASTLGPGSTALASWASRPSEHFFFCSGSGNLLEAAWSDAGRRVSGIRAELT